jgi:hypothetical protein
VKPSGEIFSITSQRLSNLQSRRRVVLYSMQPYITNSVVTTNEKSNYCSSQAQSMKRKVYFYNDFYDQTREVLVFETARAPFSRPEYLFLHEFINLYFVVHNMYRDKQTHTNGTRRGKKINFLITTCRYVDKAAREMRALCRKAHYSLVLNISSHELLYSRAETKTNTTTTLLLLIYICN